MAEIFFLLTSNNLFTKIKNVASQKLCGGVDVRNTKKSNLRQFF